MCTFNSLLQTDKLTSRDLEIHGGCRQSSSDTLIFWLSFFSLLFPVQLLNGKQGVSRTDGARLSCPSERNHFPRFSAALIASAYLIYGTIEGPIPKIPLSCIFKVAQVQSIVVHLLQTHAKSQAFRNVYSFLKSCSLGIRAPVPQSEDYPTL